MENQCEILEIEDDQSLTTQHPTQANTQEQILEYRAREQAKFASLQQKATNAPMSPKEKSLINIKPKSTITSTKSKNSISQPKSTNTDPEPKIDKGKSKAKRTVVIDDSIVKHIDHLKIGMAAGQELVVQSYRRAKVNQIKTKVQNNLERTSLKQLFPTLGQMTLSIMIQEWLQQR